MEILMLWFCPTADADLSDCKQFNLSPPVTHEQCIERKKLNMQVLGTGPEQNYRLLCEPASS